MTKKLLNVFLICVLLTISSGVSAQKNKKNLDADVLATMKRATQFMMDEVSYNGGFVWNYLPDFSRTWGEMEAKRTMVWVQPPGTPAVGHLLLDAYHATGDEYYYQAAERVTNALIWGQLPCGGWNYVFDFAGEASLKDWYNTVGKNGWRLEEFQHYYGNATFDDAGTAQASNLLLRMYVEKYDPKFKPALDKAINFVLESQYPIGGWPQRYPLRNEFSHHGNPDYSSFITLNDDVAEENIAFLIRCYQSLGDQRIMDPIIRSMNTLLLLQQGKPQAGWALQYTTDLKPAGARTYEPNGISSHGTVACINKLIEFYQLTGDTKYIARIPDALEFLESIAIPDSELAKIGRKSTPEQTFFPTFVEIGTNKPLYIHRRGSNVTNGEYYIDQDITNVIGHYGSMRATNMVELRKKYENILTVPKEELTKGSPLLEKGLVELPKYYSVSERGEASEAAAAKLVSELNARGYWPTPITSTSNPYIGDGSKTPTPGNYGSVNVGDKHDTSPYRAENPEIGISAASYVSNMGSLIKFLDSKK